MLVDSSAKLASQIALEQLSAQLQDAGNGNTLHLDSICFDLSIIHHLSFGTSSANLRSLLGQGLAPAIAKLLNILPPGARYQDGKVPRMEHCMFTTISIVSTILFSDNGPAWVSQLIDAGLVPGILSLGFWLGHLPTLRSLQGSILPPSTIPCISFDFALSEKNIERCQMNAGQSQHLQHRVARILCI